MQLVLASEFITKAKEIIILSHIAFPSAIELRSGTCKLNDSKICESDMRPMITNNRGTLEYVQEIDWPKYENVPIKLVYNWYTENNFSFGKFSTLKVDRALNAFSQLFGTRGEFDFDLFWALLGIEALYCAGKEGISNQIYEKTQVILGPMKEYKKRLKEMYDFRSKFIHGDINIPGVFCEMDEENTENFEQKNFQATDLAVGILTASLQQMIVKNLKEFKFKYMTAE